MYSWLTSSISWWHPLGYILVFIGLILEGDTVLFIAAFLAHQSFFGLGDLAVVAFASVLIGDALWYLVGYRTRDSQVWLFRWAHNIGRHFDKYLKRRPLHTIFISKFTYGVHHLILMRAGIDNLSLKEFMKKDVSATIVWMLIVGGLGYFSGLSYVVLKHYVRLTELGFLGGITLVFLIQHFFVSRKLKQNL